MVEAREDVVEARELTVSRRRRELGAGRGLEEESGGEPRCTGELEETKALAFLA